MKRSAAASGGAGAVAEPARSKETLLASARQKAEAYVQSKQKDLATRDVLPELANARSMDTERWRKLQGLSADNRVFIITGIYPDVRDALLRRGWKQNKDEESPHFDMKFALKNSEIPYATMTVQQVGNHFKGAGSITTKAGLVHCLRNAHWFVPADQFAFYPRAYDLGDAGDYADFVDDFRCVEAEKVLRAILLAGTARARTAGLLSDEAIATAMAAAGPGCAAAARPCPMSAAASASAVDLLDRLMMGAGAALAAALLHPAVVAAATAAAPSPLLINAGVADAAVSVSSKRCREWTDEELDGGAEGAGPADGADRDRDAIGAGTGADAGSGEGVAVGEPLVTPAEWEVLRYCNIFAAGGPVEQAPITRRAEEDAKALERDMNIKRDKLIRRLRRIAKKRAAAAAAAASAAGGAKGAGASESGSLAAAMAEALAKSSLAAVLEGRVAKDDEELTSLKALASSSAGGAGGAAGGEDDDDDDDDGGEDDDDGGAADESSEDEDGSDESDGDAAGAGRGAVAARGRIGVSIRGGGGGSSGGGRRAGASGGGPRPPGKPSGGAAFGHSLPPAPGGAGGKAIENSDDFNNGTGRVTNLKDRAAVAAFQLRMWRERLVKEGASAGAAEVYSDSLGDPAPSVSSSTSPAFAALTPLNAAVWTAAVQCVARINDSPACQVSLNAAAPKNIWIVKPAGKSRGRGIECAKTLAGILYNRGGDGHAEAQYVVQKYIERPLLVRGFKWDIRQWVLVTSWAPLTAWVYDRCYLRFCTYPFELDNLSNRYIHLSNNSVQKNNVAFDDAATGIEGSMWHAASFAEWLSAQDAAGAWCGLTYVPDPDAEAGNCNAPPPGSDGAPAEPVPVSGCGDVWERVLLPSMRRIIAASLQAGQEKVVARPRSFEIYGYDFMVDERLNPWLIEINASPDFSYSTPVTEVLVKEASEDAMKVVVDYAAWEEANAAAAKAARKDGASGSAAGSTVGTAGGSSAPAPSTGGWQCIFRSQAAPGRATMTCAAHGIFCAGTAIKPPPGSAAAAAAAAARRAARTVVPTLASGVIGSGLPVTLAGGGSSGHGGGLGAGLGLPSLPAASAGGRGTAAAAGGGGAAARKVLGGGTAGRLTLASQTAGPSGSSFSSSPSSAASLAVTPPVPPAASARGERVPRSGAGTGAAAVAGAATGRGSSGRTVAAAVGPTAAAAAAGVSGRRAVALSTARIDGFGFGDTGSGTAAAPPSGSSALAAAPATAGHSGIPVAAHRHSASGPGGSSGNGGAGSQQPPRYPAALPSGTGRGSQAAGGTGSRAGSGAGTAGASGAPPLPTSPGAPAPGASHFGFGVSGSATAALTASAAAAAASGASSTRASSASGSSRARSTSTSRPAASARDRSVSSRPRSTSRGATGTGSASSGPGR